MNKNNQAMEKVAFGFGFGFGFNKKRDKYAFKCASDIVEESFEKVASAAEELGVVKRPKLSKSEKKEVNKNTRTAQQSLLHKRRNIKSTAKNGLASLGGAMLGAGLGYGAYKGIVNSAGLKDAIKGAKLGRKLNNQKVFNSISEYKNMSNLASSHKAKASLKKGLASDILKKSGTPIALTTAGTLAGGAIGGALRDRSEVKKFMKERYGDSYKPTIRQNEVDKVLAKRQKTASEIVNETFSNL